MVECQWDSVVLSPYSPVLTGLELTFMCLTWSNSSLFSTPGFVVSPVGKRERGGERKGKKSKTKKTTTTKKHTHTHKKKTKTKMGRREQGNRKGGKEGRREEGIKKDRRQDKKEF